MNKPRNVTGSTTRILFVCLHGSAKSLIASEHLNRLAKNQAASVLGESAGIEPDAAVPSNVVAGLARDGIDVKGYEPRSVTTENLTAASHIVLCGCELPASLPPPASVEHWDDLPFVSDGYEFARAAIVERVKGLLRRIST